MMLPLRAFKLNARALDEANATVKALRTQLKSSEQATIRLTDQINADATSAAKTKYNTISSNLNNLEDQINNKKTTISTPDTTIKKRR